MVRYVLMGWIRVDAQHVNLMVKIQDNEKYLDSGRDAHNNFDIWSMRSLMVTIYMEFIIIIITTNL